MHDGRTTGDVDAARLHRVTRAAALRNQIGARLRALRGSRTQQDVADILEIHRMTLSRYETGDRDLDPLVVIDVCERLGCTSDWLLRAKGPAPSISVSTPAGSNA